MSFLRNGQGKISYFLLYYHLYSVKSFYSPSCFHWFEKLVYLVSWKINIVCSGYLQRLKSWHSFNIWVCTQFFVSSVFLKCTNMLSRPLHTIIQISISKMNLSYLYTFFRALILQVLSCSWIFGLNSKISEFWQHLVHARSVTPCPVRYTSNLILKLYRLDIGLWLRKILYWFRFGITWIF